MSFKPRREQQYYIVAKHSNKALSVPNGNTGNHITQQTFNPESAGQKFVFHKGHYFHWILIPAYNDRYVAVHDSSQNNGTPIIEWKWEPNAPNLTFEFVAAEDGYYRIMARHSRKYFDIHGVYTTDGAGLTQYELTGGANQLFKVIPVPNQPVGANNMSLYQANELVRTATLGLIGLIPEVGGGLKFITGLFWKEKDRFAEIWDQMKSYVDIRIRQLIKEEKLTRLGNKLLGELDVINDIKTSVATDKTRGTRLQTVIDNLVAAQRDFWVTKDEEALEIFPYMMGIGSIILALRRTMYLEYKTYFGEDPPAGVQEQNKTRLTEAIALYTGKIEKAKISLIEWRLKQIPDTRRHNNLFNNDVPNAAMLNAEASGNADLTTGLPPDPTVFNYDATAVDDYDGWSMQWKYSETYFGTSVSRTGDSDYDKRARFATDQRRSQIREQFAAEVEELLRPTKTWKYYNPDEPKGADVIVKRSVGIFGGCYGHKTFEGVAGKRITKIMTYAMAGGDLCGLEVFYDGVSDGLKGKKGNEERKIELAAGEYVNSVYGYARYIIHGMWFTTNKGIVEGGGTINNRDGNMLFYGDLPDTFNPKLVRISGAHNDSSVEQLTFHWEYLDKVLTVDPPRQD